MERNRGGRPRHPDVLTPAEWRVLDALREGGTNAEIAARLGISTNTVRYHVSNMLAKLELRDRRALAAWRPDAPRRRLGGVLALPAALWSVGRPLMWVGAGAAALAGVAVVVVALVALEGIVEGDGDPRAGVAPPPTTSTPAAPPPAPGSCATPTDPTCIHAVYIGAPGDYAQVVDIPAAMRLNGGPGGTYRVDAGLEVTVVTAARLPGGTTYTFTVSDKAQVDTTVTYHLKAARPFYPEAEAVERQAGDRRHRGRDRVRGEGLLIRGGGDEPGDEHRTRGGLQGAAGPPRHCSAGRAGSTGRPASRCPSGWASRSPVRHSA